MDRIIVGERFGIGQEVCIKGPPLEALCFQEARSGSIVTLTDSEGNDFRARVIHLSEDHGSVLVFDAFPSPTESLLEMVLLQALPERERMELIIQKATELGVSAIVPFKSERSISLGEREAKQKKAHRWQHIAIKAVQQSRRARVPLVEEVRSFQEALELCKDDLKIVLWESGGGKLKGVLKQYVSGYPSFSPFPQGGAGGFETYPRTTIYAVVGPEGGFTEEEVRQAREAGFIPVKLGQRILRTETAAITLMGILQYELGDLG